jgi:hypothetical protein
MKEPINFDKIKDPAYPASNGVYFDIRYSPSPTPDMNLVKGNTVVWLSANKYYNRIVAFVFKWDNDTNGCIVDMRFCEKGAGFKPVTTMKIHIDVSQFKSPEILKEHLSWLAIRNESLMT